MKALLLVGGKGTRLRPLTNRLPKPMVPVMGKPLLERTLETLKHHHVDEVVLSTCYKSEYISRYFGDGSNLKLKIHYVREDFPLGTGGAIKNSEQYFDDSFYVLNADILSNIDFSEMMRFHKRKKADVTIAVTRVRNPSDYGVIEYDENGYATSFREKPQKIVSHLINAGVYIFEPDVLKMIPTGKPVSVEREVFPKLLSEGRKIAVYQGAATGWISEHPKNMFRRTATPLPEGSAFPKSASQNAPSTAGSIPRSAARQRSAARSISAGTSALGTEPLLGRMWFLGTTAQSETGAKFQTACCGTTSLSKAEQKWRSALQPTAAGSKACHGAGT